MSSPRLRGHSRASNDASSSTFSNAHLKKNYLTKKNADTGGPPMSVSIVKVVRVEIKVDGRKIKAVTCQFLKGIPSGPIQISLTIGKS